MIKNKVRMLKIMTKRRAKSEKHAENKERFTVYVHPLFVLFGVWFFWRGELFLFLVYTLVAVLHEFGHAMYAARIGCRLTRLRLLPCGAVVSGDIEGIPISDEIRLALAGPFVNAACAALFAALWWVFPETYPYTDTAAFASLFLALVNLFPAYPLDGGRIVACIAVRKKGEGFAHRLMLVLGILFFAFFCALFVLSFSELPIFPPCFLRCLCWWGRWAPATKDIRGSRSIIPSSFPEGCPCGRWRYRGNVPFGAGFLFSNAANCWDCWCLTSRANFSAYFPSANFSNLQKIIRSRVRFRRF